jgi:hypothetical protein
MTNRRASWCRAAVAMVAAAAAVVLFPPPARGGADNAADFRKGAFYGRVVDSATGRPIADATVALQDPKGKLIAWTRTGPDGRYALAADTLRVLRLQPSRRRGLLARIVRGVGAVAVAPVKLAAGAVKGAAHAVTHLDPVRTARAAAASAATGNPGPVVGQLASGVADSIADQAGKKAGQGAVRAVMGERQRGGKTRAAAPSPGEVALAVSALGYKEARGVAGAYWLEPPLTAPETGVRAWLETVKLAPGAAGDAQSEIENMALLLAEPRLEPALAFPGAVVRISVALHAPADHPLAVRVFAREARKRRVVELYRQNDGRFAGELALDPRTPLGDTTISLAALRSEPVEVRLKDGDGLLTFAERLDDLEPDKPYEFDPRILASENRLDLTLTLLDPAKRFPVTTAPAPPGRHTPR